jgi:hypothetical protein
MDYTKVAKTFLKDMRKVGRPRLRAGRCKE